MDKNKNDKNGLIQSQKTLYKRLKKINRLFKIHFSSLILLFLFSIAFMILWTYLLITGQIIMTLSQRYGLFGIVVDILMTVILVILIIQIGYQIYILSLFIIKGNRSLKQAKGKEETKAALYKGIVPYITNFYIFFNRYAKEKTSLSKLVRIFLFLNFFSGFYGIFLFSRLLGAEITNPLLLFCLSMLFLAMVGFWLMNLGTSFKIRNEVEKWEQLFPKLEEWAQNVEQFSSENSNLFNTEELP
ncbi:MAG: hypothetical protein ACFFC3_15700 [Candidatus Odinarchaeota archaeon]